jgi:hypothetical protein
MTRKHDLLGELEAFYANEGILSTAFTCKFKTECKAGCDSFTGPKSAFVSSGYEAGSLPRLLFLSLDSGGGSKSPKQRLPGAVRAQNEIECDPSAIHKGKHWYRTHEIAWHILRKFKRDLSLKDTQAYFAHANSAKCCMNKSGRKQADKVLFKNCRTYLPQEIAILAPDILVTQGGEAKDSILSICDEVGRAYDEFARIVVIGGRSMFWLHTHHPANYGAFNRQRDFDRESQIVRGWESYAGKISQYIKRKGK